jgi:ketosteroid isomerase-like protein
MSQENVETLKRGVDAYNRRDVDALLADCDPEIEWRPAILAHLAGAQTVYRGHEGVREMLGDAFEVLAEMRLEYSEIRDLGERTIAIGRIRTRGRESGVETESPVAAVTDFKDGKAIRVRTYFDLEEALQAAGLAE